MRSLAMIPYGVTSRWTAIVQYQLLYIKQGLFCFYRVNSRTPNFVGLSCFYENMTLLICFVIVHIMA